MPVLRGRVDWIWVCWLYLPASDVRSSCPTLRKCKDDNRKSLFAYLPRFVVGKLRPNHDDTPRSFPVMSQLNPSRRRALADSAWASVPSFLLPRSPRNSKTQLPSQSSPENKSREQNSGNVSRSLFASLEIQFSTARYNVGNVWELWRRNLLEKQKMRSSHQVGFMPR